MDVCWTLAPSLGKVKMLFSRVRSVSMLLSTAGEGDNSPEAVTSDSDQTFGAQLGREAPRMVEGIKDERRELEHILVGVVEPRATREGENGGRAVDGNASELNGAGAEETGCEREGEGSGKKEKREEEQRTESWYR